MPRFGEAHKLLSPTHPDTSPPAGGADPSDGQVVTWSDALKAWTALDPTPGGVTVHGLLTGLDVDDHAQYALLAGRSGGQALSGGLAASEHLTLQSTAHATRGYVRAQDDLQLLSNIIRDSGGNARLTLATSSPEVSATGDLVGSNHLALGGAVISVSRVLNLSKDLATTPSAQGASFSLYGIAATGVQVCMGVAGGAFQRGTPTLSFALGLDYAAQQDSSSPMYELYGIRTALSSGASGSGAIATAYGLRQQAPSWTNAKPTTVYGIRIDNQGASGVGTAEGLHIGDQTAATARLLELGPAVPYLRLLGGANPAANESHLYLKLGATLKQVTEYDADSAGAGFRALRVPN